VWKFHESTFREKSPARVVEELAAIDAPNVFITDDIFWMNVKRGREMAEALIASGIKKHYTIQTRSDIITRFPDLVAAWRECGDLSVFLGLEKIDDEGLASVNKGNTAANNERALEILADLGVGYTPNFIVDPSWDRSDFDKLKRWIDRTGAYNSGFSVLTPLPGQISTSSSAKFCVRRCRRCSPAPRPLWSMPRPSPWKRCASGARPPQSGKGASCNSGSHEIFANPASLAGTALEAFVEPERLMLFSPDGHARSDAAEHGRFMAV
jgi:hypothetical protein